MTEGISAGFYFVAFVDLLGQRVKLAQFKEVAPKTDEEKAAFEQALAETAGVVRNVRDSVARWIEAGREINEDTREDHSRTTRRVLENYHPCDLSVWVLRQLRSRLSTASARRR